MSRADMIPDKVWRKAMYEYHKIIRIRPASAWQEAIAASLAAWPNVTTTSWFENGVRKAAMTLPLPLEASDE